MASDYGLNFGFRRSDESVRVSEGRFKTPADGPVLLQGTLVTVDEAGNPGYLKVAEANAPLVTGFTGLLVQEEAWDFSIYEANGIDSFELNKTKKNRLSVITSGAGVKIWLRNTPAQDRADGRSIPEVTMVDVAGVNVGDTLGWDGTTYVPGAEPLMTVTYVDEDKGFVEAVLNA